VEATNRKLIRPPFYTNKEKHEPKRQFASAPPGGAAGIQKKPVPPESTNAENFYYVKQIQLKTPMVLVLRDGEKVEGVIDWYDKACLRVTNSECHFMVYKDAVKYMYKAEA
jgi:sRNA-binding regulator protein Hfq